MSLLHMLGPFSPVGPLWSAFILGTLIAIIIVLLTELL